MLSNGGNLRVLFDIYDSLRDNFFISQKRHPVIFCWDSVFCWGLLFKRNLKINMNACLFATTIATPPPPHTHPKSTMISPIVTNCTEDEGEEVY